MEPDMSLQFTLSPEPEFEAREAGRLMFAGPVDFVKGVVINYFDLGGSRFLVDLPGYGYAEAPVAIVAKWQALLKSYLAGRQTLRRAFVLIDTRHGVKAVDEEILQLLDRSAVTFQAVLTKADKVSKAERDAVIEQVKGALAKHPAAYPEIVVTSSEKGDGIETLRAIIATLV
jgi:GTP-binding protein